MCLLVFDRVGDPCPWSEPTLAWHLCGLLRADGYHYGINSILAKIRKAKRTTYARTLAAMIVRMGNGVTAAAPVVLP